MPSASSKNVRAGGAFVEFFAKDGALDASLRRIGSKLKNFGASASMTGAMVSGVGAVAAAPFAMGIRTFANYEQGMANVRALTKATDEQFKLLSQTARQLGKETQFTAREATDAMYVFAMAGMEAEKIALAVGPALNLAAAGDIGIAEAADITMKVMAGMGIEAENLGHTIDVLAKAQATANTNMSQLGQAMKYVAPTAKQAKYSIEDTLAAVQLLSNAGQQADMAGTSLSGGIMSLTQPSAEAAKTLERLGVRVRDAQGNMQPLANIIDDLNNGLAGLGSADRLQVIGQIFDARQARGFAELISQGGQALRDASAALQDSEGEAARIAAVKMNTIEGRLEIAKSAIDDMFITIGQIFVEPVKRAIEGLTFLVNKTSEWIEANHNAVRIAAKVAMGIVVLGGALTATGVTAMTAGIVVGSLMKVLWLSVLPIKFITGAWAIMSTVISLTVSPLGLVVAALAALFYWSGAGGAVLGWLSEQFGPLATIAKETFAAISTAMTNGNWEDAGNVVWAALKLVWVKGSNTLSSIWGTMTEAAGFTWRGLIDALSMLWSDMTFGFESIFMKTVMRLTKVVIDLKQQLRQITQSEADMLKFGVDITASVTENDIQRRAQEAQQELQSESEKWMDAKRAKDKSAVSDSAKAVADARAEYEAAMKAATEAKPAPEGSTPGNGKPSAVNMTNLGETLAPMIAKTGGIGGGITLSSMASRMFGGGTNVDYLKQIALNTADTAAAIEEMNKPENIDKNMQQNWIPVA